MVCRSRTFFSAAVIVALAAALFGGRLDLPLLEPQEARYAEIPRQMMEQSHLVVPVLHGEPYLDKPPLLYWSVMVGYRLFGVSDRSARLIPALCGIGTALVLWLWGRRCFGERIGFTAAVLFCLMPEAVYRGRMVTFDTLLMLCVTATLAFGSIACRGSTLGYRWWLLSALAAGAGLLTKGTVLFVLAGVPLFALARFDPTAARPRLRDWFLWTTVACAVAAPWYIAILQCAPEFGGYFFWRHNIVRFAAPFDHAQPVWYYLPAVLLCLLPWSLLFVGFRRLILVPEARFSIACFLWMLAFFSAAGCKRPTWLLPAYPPLALALAWLVHRWRAGVDLWFIPGRVATVAGSIVVLFAVAGGISAYLRGMVDGVPLILLGSFAFMGAGAIVILRQLSWREVAVGSAVGLCLGVWALLPGYHEAFSLRTALQELKPDSDAEIVCYPQRFDSVSFYRPGCRVRVFGPEEQDPMFRWLEAHPGTPLIVKSESTLRSLLGRMPDRLTWHETTRTGTFVAGRLEPAEGDRTLTSLVLPVPTEMPKASTRPESAPAPSRRSTAAR